jgi:hypothetical protein
MWILLPVTVGVCALCRLQQGMISQSGDFPKEWQSAEVSPAASASRRKAIEYIQTKAPMPTGCRPGRTIEYGPSCASAEPRRPR